MQQPFVAERPVLAPAADWLGMLKRARTLLEQREVVQWVEHVRLAVVTAWVPGDDLVLMQNLDLKRVGLDDKLRGRALAGHRVAVGLENDLAVGGQAGRDGEATSEIARRQFSEQRLFGRPQCADGSTQTVDLPRIILKTALQQQVIQGGEG